MVSFTVNVPVFSDPPLRPFQANDWASVLLTRVDHKTFEPFSTCRVPATDNALPVLEDPAVVIVT